MSRSPSPAGSSATAPPPSATRTASCSVTISPRTTRAGYGPVIETDPALPEPHQRPVHEGPRYCENIQIEIWERGAGYTLASGSSSCAAAAVARRIGKCGPEIAVHMPGGVIQVSISDDFSITMTGPVTKVCEGILAREMFEASCPPAMV